ncbi:MAG TPA: serine endopeptidase [Burkholderiaceae bacterium]
MAKGLRLSEKWFRRGLWLVAVVFALFLSGLGGAIVGDLPRVEQAASLSDFLGPDATVARQAVAQARSAEQQAQDALEQAELKARTAQADSRAAREAFDNWLAARQVTGRVGEDAELRARTQALDQLKVAERQAQAKVEAQQQAELDARQAAEHAQAAVETLELAAREQLQSAERSQELRVFGYRLALTLPLLALAGWLFARKRKSTYWPFVWGFIFFALFTFFVELVPYLPSYGGYVRYAVGIVVTALAGRYAITAFNRYLERQKQAEALPDAQRRQDLDYDVALARLAKGACPGCERTVDLKDPGIDFCPHCGIGLFNHCGVCSTRKSAFVKFCPSCGTEARAHGGSAALSPAA